MFSEACAGGCAETDSRAEVIAGAVVLVAALDLSMTTARGNGPGRFDEGGVGLAGQLLASGPVPDGPFCNQLAAAGEGRPPTFRYAREGGPPVPSACERTGDRWPGSAYTAVGKNV